MNVDVLLGDTDDANLTDIASYYTGNCSTENVIVGGIIATQEISVPTMKSTIPALYKVGGTGTVLHHFSYALVLISSS